MDNETEEAAEKVSIMTLHAAKGLEFPCVFLPGWEDGLFPSQRAMDESGLKGLEEERSLAYVGITRAQRLCTISFAANRRIYNQWQSAMPSRFVDELPEAHVEVLTPPGLYGGGFGTAAPSTLADVAAKVRRLQLARLAPHGLTRDRAGRREPARGPHDDDRRDRHLAATMSGPGSSTRSSATAPWKASKATSCRSRSTRPAQSMSSRAS
jgi:DNA helicase II / ATP-dependent DNA helicase PcrA